jgi:hypothetical protein
MQGVIIAGRTDIFTQVALDIWLLNLSPKNPHNFQDLCKKPTNHQLPGKPDNLNHLLDTSMIPEQLLFYPLSKHLSEHYLRVKTAKTKMTKKKNKITKATQIIMKQ